MAMTHSFIKRNDMMYSYIYYLCFYIIIFLCAKCDDAHVDHYSPLFIAAMMNLFAFRTTLNGSNECTQFSHSFDYGRASGTTERRERESVAKDMHEEKI